MYSTSAKVELSMWLDYSNFMWKLCGPENLYDRTAYNNRPISQIPQCIRQISHNATFCNRNVHMSAHFCYKNALWGYGTDAFWDLWNGSIDMCTFVYSFSIIQWNELYVYGLYNILNYNVLITIHQMKYFISSYIDHTLINSLRSSAAYMLRSTKPSLIKIVACRLFGTKPLYERILIYCQLNHWEQISVKRESKFKHFHSRKCLKMSSAKW